MTIFLTSGLLVNIINTYNQTYKIVKNVFKTDIKASSSSNIASNVGHNVKIKTKSDELYFDGENSNIYNLNSIKNEGEKLLYV